MEEIEETSAIIVYLVIIGILLFSTLLAFYKIKPSFIKAKKNMLVAIIWLLIFISLCITLLFI